MILIFIILKGIKLKIKFKLKKIKSPLKRCYVRRPLEFQTKNITMNS